MNTAKAFFSAAATGVRKHWPKIAVGTGSAFLLVGGYLLGREIPKYKAEVAEKERMEPGKLPVKEKAKIAAKHFTAPTCAIVGGTLFITASVCENSRRAKLGATACAISELSTGNLIDYKEAAKEILGEEKEKEIEKKAEEKKLERAMPVPQTSIPDGLFWCYDVKFGGEPFLTDVNTLKAAENKIRGDLLELGEGDSISMNDFYDLVRDRMAIKNEDASVLDYFGWINDGKYAHAKPEINIGSDVKNGIPVLTIAPNALIIDPDYFEMTSLDY